jgi:hypothetical protein
LRISPDCAGNFKRRKNCALVAATDDSFYLEELQRSFMKITIAFVLAAFLFTHCKKHSQAPSPANPTIYVAGSIGDRAVVWKNGRPSYLTLSSGYHGSQALGMTVSGSDVFVAGLQSTDTGAAPTYWKNGSPVILPSHYGGAAFSIAVSGADVFAAGEFNQPNGEELGAYWKNGQAMILKDSQWTFRAFAIDVSGANVYIGGESTAPIYWANGEFVSLPQTGYSVIDIFSIAVSGGDLYLAGTYYGVGYYWKNGIPIAVNSSFATGSETPNSIAVSDNDVYLAGGNGVACYWKNGAQYVLSDGTHFEAGTGIALADTSVYVSGFENTPPTAFAKYWKNGVAVNLADSAVSSVAVAICLVQ